MNTTISPSKSHIQEANKHLQMLHNRVEQLEKTLSTQANEFSQREQDREIHYEELLKIKEAEISSLKDKNKKSELIIEKLSQKLQMKNDLLIELNDKSRVLDQILQCKPILESMVNLMGVYESFSQPSDTVKSDHMKDKPAQQKDSKLNTTDDNIHRNVSKFKNSLQNYTDSPIQNHIDEGL